MTRIRIHTVPQPPSDVTVFFLSCDRLALLEQTHNSFASTCSDTVKKVILDDSANPDVFEQLVNTYGNTCDVICFPENHGQWWAWDFMVSYCTTEFIFYVEDDWRFLQPDYISKSRDILQRYRTIGGVDISWRTFAWQGIDSYHAEKIDDLFFYKKTWRISENFKAWHGWMGSPNLRRRDDLLLLGRMEKYFTEWSIDRKFLALGLDSVFLDGQYVEHIGDDHSRAHARREREAESPENRYPTELLPQRIWPVFDYNFLDTEFWQRSQKKG